VVSNNPLQENKLIEHALVRRPGGGRLRSAQQFPDPFCQFDEDLILLGLREPGERPGRIIDRLVGRQLGMFGKETGLEDQWQDGGALSFGRLQQGRQLVLLDEFGGHKFSAHQQDGHLRSR
jgi:hypothetical protein